MLLPRNVHCLIVFLRNNAIYVPQIHNGVLKFLDFKNIEDCSVFWVPVYLCQISKNSFTSARIRSLIYRFYFKNLDVSRFSVFVFSSLVTHGWKEGVNMAPTSARIFTTQCFPLPPTRTSLTSFISWSPDLVNKPVWCSVSFESNYLKKQENRGSRVLVYYNPEHLAS